MANAYIFSPSFPLFSPLWQPHLGLLHLSKYEPSLSENSVSSLRYSPEEVTAAHQQEHMLHFPSWKEPSAYGLALHSWTDQIHGRNATHELHRTVPRHASGLAEERQKVTGRSRSPQELHPVIFVIRSLVWPR